MTEDAGPVFAFRIEVLTRIHAQLTWAEKAAEYLGKIDDMEASMLVGEWAALKEGKAPNGHDQSHSG